MMAIQAVDEKIQGLVIELETDQVEDDGDLELLLLDFEKAALNLKFAYIEVLKTTSNLPSY
jgi:hypothetical protein